MYVVTELIIKYHKLNKMTRLMYLPEFTCDVLVSVLENEN